jgi:hypothetical protein
MLLLCAWLCPVVSTTELLRRYQNRPEGRACHSNAPVRAEVQSLWIVPSVAGLIVAVRAMFWP